MQTNSESESLGSDTNVTAVDEESGMPLADVTRYVPYSAAAFAQASDKRRVIFFYANWCSTCTPANKDISENADQIPQDVLVFKADYDTELILKKQYGITYQHTFVQVDSRGNTIAFWNGGGMKELLENVL